jgi:hypothetical protein
MTTTDTLATREVLDAARILLSRMGINPADLLLTPEDRPPLLSAPDSRRSGDAWCITTAEGYRHAYVSGTPKDFAGCRPDYPRELIRRPP